MLAVNKYKEILLEEFYLSSDDMTIRRNKNGYYGRFKKHDVVIPFKLCKYGYGGIHIPRTRTTVAYHQLLTLLRGIDIPDGSVIDHINGDINDNRRENLRVTVQAINCKNSKKSKNNTSGHTGISWNKAANRYIVRKYLKGKRQYGGSAPTLEEALVIMDNLNIKAYQEGYTERHGK